MAAQKRFSEFGSTYKLRPTIQTTPWPSLLCTLRVRRYTRVATLRRVEIGANFERLFQFEKFHSEQNSFKNKNHGDGVWMCKYIKCENYSSHTWVYVHIHIRKGKLLIWQVILCNQERVTLTLISRGWVQSAGVVRVRVWIFNRAPSVEGKLPGEVRRCCFCTV